MLIFVFRIQVVGHPEGKQELLQLHSLPSQYSYQHCFALPF